VTSDSDNKSTLTLSEKIIDWLHRTAYFVECERSPDEAVRKWLEIENKGPIDKEILIEDNPVGWLCYNAYDNKQ